MKQTITGFSGITPVLPPFLIYHWFEVASTSKNWGKLWYVGNVGPWDLYVCYRVFLVADVQASKSTDVNSQPGLAFAGTARCCKASWRRYHSVMETPAPTTVRCRTSKGQGMLDDLTDNHWLYNPIDGNIPPKKHPISIPEPSRYLIPLIMKYQDKYQMLPLTHRIHVCYIW